MGFWSWVFRRRTDITEFSDPLFARRRRIAETLDVLVPFNADDEFYEEVRKAAGNRQMSVFIRASIRLGLGVFLECPQLMAALDTRGHTSRSMTVHVTQAVHDRMVVVSGNYKARLIRASVELGLIYFRAHPEHISMLESGEL